MAYSADRKPGELTALTTLATDDVIVVGDTSDASEVAKGITKANLITDLSTSFATAGHNHTGVYAPVLGADDNYVTDAEKAALHPAVTVTDGTTVNLTITGQDLTAEVIDGTITLAKQANVATGTVFYRKTALTGVPEVQTLATLKTDLGLSNTNSGDQTTIAGITGTKAQFDTAVTDGNFMYAGDAPTSHTHALSEVVDSTTEALGVGSLEVGHASDTTLSRVSAGVVAVEGVTVPTISSTSTLTNKRIQPRTSSTTTASTLTPDVSSYSVYFRTTQTEALTIGAPTGTPVIGETIMIYVDSAGAQTLTMNATYKVFGAAFPATTTAGKTLMLSCQYNGTDWKTLWALAI